MTDDKKKARGLQDLIAEHKLDDLLEGETIVEIPLEKIVPNPYQPRRIFDVTKINELAESIREHGVFQPIIVKSVKDGYMIVAGERRFRASRQVGLKSIPAIVRAYQEEKVAQIALVENLQREDLTAIEEAEAYLNVMKHLKLTQQELAIRIGKSRAHITNILGLLNLPESVQTMILKRQLSMGHARALSKLEDPQIIHELADKIIFENLSVRAAESLTSSETKMKAIKRKSKPILYKRYEKSLSTQLKVKAKIIGNKLILEGQSEQQLIDLIEELLKHDV